MATKASTKGKTSVKKESKESKETIDLLRKQLIKRREDLAASVKNHALELPDTGMDGSPGDTADQAASDYTTEMFGALLERQAGTLEEVDRALRKIENGDFGICEHCEKAIPSKRLKSLPWARFCLECQEKSDRRGAARKAQAEPAEWETVEE